MAAPAVSYSIMARQPGGGPDKLIQPQNFPRPTLEADVDPEELAAAVKTGDPDALRSWGKPVDVLISGLRCALTAAEGKVFGAGDFSMIEACVLLALAGQHDKCKLITEGADVYRDMAATIYGFDRGPSWRSPRRIFPPMRPNSAALARTASELRLRDRRRRFLSALLPARRRRQRARRQDRRGLPQYVGADCAAPVA